MVNEFNAKVSAREFVRDSDVLFIDYAREWLKLYKADASLNTRKMYENIIEKHFRDITCRIGDVSRAVYVFTINNIEGARTRQQAAMTFKQVIKSAVRDRLIAPAALDEIFEDSIKIKYKSPENAP